jgi:hypothetical protein
MSVTPTQGLVALLNAIKEAADEDVDEALLKEIAASVYAHLLDHGFGLARLSDEAVEQWSVMRLLAYGDEKETVN